MNIKLESTFTAQCDKESRSFSHKYEALRWLAGRIKKNHPRTFSKIEAKGRRFAQGQNGCGYWDDGKSRNSGWQKAQSTFRQAWIEKALDNILEWPDQSENKKIYCNFNVSKGVEL